MILEKLRDKPWRFAAVSQECLECGGATIVIQSRVMGYGRYRRFQCKNCQHRFNITYGKQKAERLIDNAAVMAIRQSTDGHQLLADQHGCSRELIRQIRNGSIYKDLLPEWFRSPPKAGDLTCRQCQFYVKAKLEQIEVEAQKESCSLGIPEFETEGVRAIRDCSAVAVNQQPSRSGPAAPEAIGYGLLGPAVAAPPAGTLLAAFGGPEQDQQRQ